MKFCNICRKKTPTFNPVTDVLTDKLKSANFPYTIDSFETLNHKHYTCPNCDSSDRDRLIFRYLSTKVNPNAKLNILEFAPSLPLSKAIKQLFVNSTYRTADLFMHGVDDKVDITNMKNTYEDNRFDIIVCSHILEHVDSDLAAMEELKRILSKSGHLLLLTPIIDDDVFDEDISVVDVDERWRRFAQDDHVRLYSKDVFLERLNISGLKTSEITTKRLNLLVPSRLGISKKSILYVCTK